MTVVRKTLLMAIEELKKEVITMANIVMKNINDSLYAFEQNDFELANDISKRDVIVDSYEEQIAKQALAIIWKEQPLASDLRFVTGVLKLITDLERIGDHAIDIAEITIEMNKVTKERNLPLITEMAMYAKKMVFDSIEALFKIDVDLANSVIIEDDKVDELFAEIHKRIIEQLKNLNANQEFLVNLIMVAKYIERIADHAVNISEWIIFIESGSHKSASLF